MNHQTWGKFKFWGVLVAVFISGGVIASPSSGDTAQADTQAIQELDTIDRQIFSVTGEIIDAQMTALETAGTLFGQYPYITAADFENGTAVVNQQTQRIEQANRELESLRIQREQIIK